MPRLNQKAFNLLKAELQRLSSTDIAGQTLQNIGLKRLEKLCVQEGPPLTLTELRDMILDLYPAFNEAVLAQAIAANGGTHRPRSTGSKGNWQKLQWSAIAIIAVPSVIGFLNLPYPMIRWPVAKVAPILLLPSFMSMDHHYRQAISLVEQSDQLVNQATSAADLALGTTKVKAAQKSLDALPVWFLGYYPVTYCNWMQCTWRFTLDEFQQARKDIGRMEARLFQENNAQTKLEAADLTLGNIKQQYQEAPNEGERSQAIAQWQQAIDTLHQIPRETLAGRTAATKLKAYERDFERVAKWSDDTARSGNLIGAAQAFASLAQQSAAGDMHTAAEWEEIQRQWEMAIARLDKIDVKDPNYAQAQKLLATYHKNLGTAKTKLKTEQESVQAFAKAQQATEQLLATLNGEGDRASIARQLQSIVNDLQKVKKGTTVYAEAQDYKQSAEARLR
jgi:tetratricopeptide (TPR) repeat protein